MTVCARGKRYICRMAYIRTTGGHEVSEGRSAAGDGPRRSRERCSTEDLGLSGLGQSEVVGQVAITQVVDFTGIDQPRHGILTDRLQQDVARLGTPLIGGLIARHYERRLVARVQGRGSRRQDHHRDGAVH
jgi:hypothetical protein